MQHRVYPQQFRRGDDGARFFLVADPGIYRSCDNVGGLWQLAEPDDRHPVPIDEAARAHDRARLARARAEGPRG